jgi:hypothetical protein
MRASPQHPQGLHHRGLGGSASAATLRVRLRTWASLPISSTHRLDLPVSAVFALRAIWRASLIDSAVVCS